jgi:hypothetical protein
MQTTQFNDIHSLMQQGDLCGIESKLSQCLARDELDPALLSALQQASKEILAAHQQTYGDSIQAVAIESEFPSLSISRDTDFFLHQPGLKESLFIRTILFAR